MLDNATLVRRALPLLVGVVLMLTCIPSNALQVYGNGLLISNGDLSPRLQDLTEFGTQSVVGPAHIHTFTVVNDSTGIITVSLEMSESAPAGELDYFSHTLPVTPVLGPQQSTTFTVTFLAAIATRHTANILVSSGGGACLFAIGGAGGRPLATLYGNGKVIPNGSATPALSNHTAFGAAAIGSSVTRVFTITNASDCELVLSAGGGSNYVAITGPDAYGFTVIQQPTAVLLPGSGTTFQVRFAPDVDTLFEAEVAFHYNTDNESPFTFAIAGTVSAPDMDVVGKGVPIPSGSVVPMAGNGTHFGEVPLTGAKATNNFTIQNTGALMLILTGSPPVRVTGPRAADFTVTVQPVTNVAAGNQTTFRLVFDPGIAGACDAAVSIGNNDPDENPYTFAVRGDGGVPEIDLAGNGVSIPSGDTTPSTNDDTQFGPVRRGNSHTHTFTVWNYGGMTLVLTGAPPIRITGAGAADFVAGTITTNVGPHSPEGFTVQFTPSTTGVRQATVSIPNTDTNESPYTFLIGGAGISPEITVLGNATVIADGDFAPGAADDTDYGNVPVLRGMLTRTFIIRNDGNDTLNLSAPLTLSGLGEFTLAQPPSTPIPAGSSTIFRVTFAPIGTGSQSNDVRIFSDDLDEGSYDFAICGTGVTPAMAVNGNGQWIPTGSQTPATANDTYFGGSICGSNHSHVFTVTNSGTLDLSLTGTPQMVFSGPATGDFAVTAWPASLVPVNHATNFTVRFRPTAGGRRVATVSIPSSDPQRDPYTFAMAGFGFQTLTNDVPVALSASPATNGFYFQCLTSGWSVIAVTPRSGNFDLDVSTNTSLTPKIAMSQQTGTNFDYALINGHMQTASCALYAQVYGAAAGSYLVESEWTIPDLQIGQFYEGLHLGTNESVDLFEANLTALDDYYISLSRTATNAALTFYVFGPSHATAVVGDHDAAQSASGTNLTARLLYTPLESGWHAILVVDTSRRECDYGLGILSGPTMRLLGNGIAVTNRDVTPRLADNTDLGATDVDGAASPRLFTVENPGVGDLRLTSSPPVRITGTASNQFTVPIQPSSTIGPGSSANLFLAFAPNRCGLSTATVVIANNDAAANPFSISIQGHGFHRLVDDLPRAFSNTAEELVFRGSAINWAGMAIRAAPQDRTLVGTSVPDWSAACVTSAAAGTAVEAILVAATGSTTDCYARVSGGTTSNYIADYEATVGLLYLGSASSFIYGSNDVLALFSLTLDGGAEYYVATDPALGGDTADMSLLVMRPDRRWGSRSDCDWSAQAGGTGIRESVAFVAPVTGLYAVAVLQESRAAGNWWVLAARAVPDMLVLGNSSSIVNGSDTPSLANHTRFDAASTLGSSTRTFTIRNDGYKNLALGGNPRVSITGINPADFTVTQMPATNVTLRGGTTTFTVTFRPRGRGVRQAQVSIANSQADRTPFTFAIAGTAIGPLMRVEGMGYDIPDGSLVPVTTNGTDFGARTAGAHTRDRQFDILNAGDDMLGLTGSPPVVITGPQAADFAVDTSSLGTPVGVGGQTSFRIIFQPKAEGIREATVRIRCDDPERDPFEFAVRGEGALPRITRLRYPGTAVELRWDSLDETLYTIQSANRLTDGFTNPVQRNILGDWGETTLAFPAPTNRTMFYRITVQP